VAKGAVDWVAARDLLPGMVMRVASGERLAADGEIIAVGAPGDVLRRGRDARIDLQADLRGADDDVIGIGHRDERRIGGWFADQQRDVDARSAGQAAA